MKKRNLMDEQISELMANQDISDESIYVVYQFLTDLLAEFESQAYGRLRRYTQEQEKIQKEMCAAQINSLT
jgi:hypothetical protein